MSEPIVEIPGELWAVRATPDDPNKKKFLIGEGCLLGGSKKELEQIVNRSRSTIITNGVSSVEVVRIR